MKSPDDGQPWLKREDWAKGRIASGSKKSVFFLWLFTVVWNLISAPVVFIGLPAELHKGNHAILIALLFPIVGLTMIFFALNTTLAWRRFGQSIFEMAAIPGAPGGTLAGEIQVNARLRPEHGLHLRLSCVHRTTAGSGKNRSTSEKILWQDDRWLRADLPQTDLNATGIPVYFKLPADQPESTTGHGDGVRWRLEASAKLRGPDFHATFEVPVFKLPEPPEISDDPTTPYQMSLVEVRQQIHSKIQVNDLPDGGKEFIFPAARNVGPATGLTLIWLIWTGIVAALFWNWRQVPAIFPLLFGAFDLLISLFTFDFWFRCSRVVVMPTQMQIETSWLGLKKRRTLEASKAAAITADIGAAAGHSAYFDLKVRTCDGAEITVAKNLGGKPEADWLVQQMAGVLKRPA